MPTSLQSMSLFAVFLTMQIVGVIILPSTQGFTKLWPTTFCVVTGIAAVFCLSRLIADGADLGLLFPLAAAVLPLLAIVVGAVLFGESLSAAKAGLLIVACVLIGISSRV
jgi:multidrug transporter EmrE-like cation transporter